MEKLDRVLDLLSIKRRRYVLYYLEERGGPVPLSEVVAKVEEWENGVSSEQDDDDDREILIQLKHRDIPKMREAEYIEYDPERGEIEISGMPAEVEVLLSVTEAIEQPAEDDIIHL